MRFRKVWWTCDGCGREEHSVARPHRCEPDRLGKHPVMRPMGPRFLQGADSATCAVAELVEQTGMSPQSLGPMFLSRRVAEDEARLVQPPVSVPKGGPG